MFRGVNSLNLDVKGRMAMPTRYRQHLSDVCAGQMVITVDNADRCLLLYPLHEWEVVERKLQKLPSFNKQARRLQRLLIGHATEVEMDGSGRLLVPPPLREFADLEKRVVLIGQSNKFELWGEELWNQRRSEWLAEDDELGDLPEEMETMSL
ncbi:MAG: division/cell wall cluster transcriptional repressor MraZ [Ectothiorhodospiraceae bacterium]|nr:division/cell wall cluster transcriptional repressor MraZ [Ectothiorhodospiraceae bacterium]